MTTLALPRPIAPRPIRLSPAALGRLSDAELAFLADHSVTPSTRAAALLVLVGRSTAAAVLAAAVLAATDSDTE